MKQFNLCQSTIWKKMPTGTFTYNALRTKIVKYVQSHSNLVPRSLEIDYSRAPCLGADQKARGLWERDWSHSGQTCGACAVPAKTFA